MLYQVRAMGRALQDIKAGERYDQILYRFKARPGSQNLVGHLATEDTEFQRLSDFHNSTQLVKGRVESRTVQDSFHSTTLSLPKGRWLITVL